jgi:hypothetical protein
VKRGRLLKEGQSLMVPAPTTDLSPGNGPLVTRTLSFLSSRAKPRDLRFSGTFLETLGPILNKFVVSPERSVNGEICDFPSATRRLRVARPPIHRWCATGICALPECALLFFPQLTVRRPPSLRTRRRRAPGMRLSSV